MLLFRKEGSLYPSGSFTKRIGLGYAGYVMRGSSVTEDLQGLYFLPLGTSSSLVCIRPAYQGCLYILRVYLLRPSPRE